MRSGALNVGLRTTDNNDVTILTLVFLRIQVFYEVALCPWMSGSRYFERYTFLASVKNKSPYNTAPDLLNT